jgi:PAS domain S-box-containing protein
MPEHKKVQSDAGTAAAGAQPAGAQPAGAESAGAESAGAAVIGAESAGGRKQVSMQEAMQDAELRLRAMFDHTFQLMGVLTPAGRVLEMNRAALDFAGLRSEDVVGRAFWETGWWCHSEAERVRLRAAISEAAAGRFVRYEVDLPGADGELRTIDLSLNPVLDEEGQVAFLIPEGRDISETKWAERALRVSEAKFAGIIAIASEAIISVDEHFEITLFNRGAEAIFGHTAADVLGQPLDVLLPPRFRGAHGQHMRHFAGSQVAARRMGERQEIHGLRKDGTEFPAEASISKLDLFGTAVFTVVLRDITDRKRVERSQRFLAQAGAILASTLDYEMTLSSVAGLTVPDLADWCVVYIRDEGGAVRRIEVAHADPAKRELLHELLLYPLDPRTPHPVFPVFETGEAEVMNDVGDSFLRALSLSDEHYALYRQLGLGSLLVVPLIARGETRGAMGYFSSQPRRYGPDELALAQDLGVLSALAVDNARLYRNAQAAVQARDDMMAVVSHDLGNPLSAIRIGTSLLLRTIPRDQMEAGGWKHLEFIRQSAQQMENLVNDLLDVKRLEAGKVSLQLQDVSVQDVVLRVMDVFQPIADGCSVDLVSKCEAALPRVRGDAQRLEQVLSNLVSNALKFTSAGGRVTVNARSAGDHALVTVVDTGVGIAPDHLPHVFDRFWQGRKQGKKGLGLGLAIAKGLVEAHGGRIWVESVPGEGTTFLFTVPTAAAGAAAR